MISMTLLTLPLIFVVTPMKMSFVLVILSVSMSLWTYMTSSSVFCASALIISFSSGMMIMFCYTAMMSNYENKMSLKYWQTMIILGVIFCGLVCFNPAMSEMQSKNTMMFMSMPIITSIMMVVILSMKSINYVIMDPTKSLYSSY